MSNESGEHLSSDQVSWWLEEGEAGAFASDRSAREGVDTHLSRCGHCAALLVTQKSVAEDLCHLEIKVRAERSAACPAETKWPEVVAGLIFGDEADALLRHGAQCDYCGPLLRAAFEDMNSELSAEERAMLSQLPSAGSVGQADLARRMAQEAGSGAIGNRRETEGHVRRARRWSFLIFPSSEHSYGLALAAAALIVVSALAAWIFQRPRTAPVEELLAKAYTADRQFELRIPGAEYAPLQQDPTTRGDAVAKKKRYLRRAQDEIDDNLQKAPDDPKWQQADAVADILRGDSDAAVATLEKLQRLHPDSAQLMNDLGIAFFQQSQKNKDKAEVLVALDWMARAYQASRNNPDPVIVFNYAFVLEKVQHFQDAKSRWEEYRNLDRTSLWNKEAQDHIDWIDQNAKQHTAGEFGPTSDSEAFLEEGISSWLPAAFSLSRNSPSGDSGFNDLEA